MRDENARIREKFELSLDGRQIASIVVGALVIVGVVFVLGLNVGRQIAARQAEAAHAGDLEALDRAPAGAAHVDEKTLTFHDRLTKEKPAVQPPVPEAKPAAVEPPRETAVAATPAVAPPDATPAATQAAAEPATATATPTASPAATTTTSAATATTAKTATPVKTATKTATPAKTATATATRTATAPAKPAAHKPEKFAVQLGASKSRADAERLAARFQAYHAHVVPGAGRWWRVRAGSFESREAAERFQRDVARRTGASAVVVASR
jgi:cell division protein FtsN